MYHVSIQQDSILEHNYNKHNSGTVLDCGVGTIYRACCLWQRHGFKWTMNGHDTQPYKRTDKQSNSHYTTCTSIHALLCATDTRDLHDNYQYLKCV